MSRRKGDREEFLKEEPNYELNKKAVDDLVDATKENTPQYSEAELKKYRGKGGLKLPSWFKAIMLKVWFAGVVCFFFMWGLGMYIPSTLDLFFVTSVAMGFVTDLLVNNIFRFYATTEGANDRWMMCPKKSYLSLILNVLYAFLVMTCLFFFYNLVNLGIIRLSGNADTVPFGVEPITFGFLYLGFDMLFLSMKHQARRILDDAKEKVKKGV